MIKITECGDQKSQNVIVLIPGIISTHDYWRDVIKVLGKKSRIISFDLLGFGHSPKPQRHDYCLKTHTSEVESAIKSLNLRESYVLVGHSFGAMIALRMASQHPKRYKKVIISGLPLIDKTTGPKQVAEIARCPEAIVRGPLGWMHGYAVWLVGPIMRLFVHKLFPDMPAHVIKDTTRIAPWSLMRSIRSMLTYSPKEYLASNTAKTLLIFGSKDSIADDVHSKLGSLPKNYQLKFYDCDHQIPLRLPGKLARDIQF